jgi:hypothetical protein
VDARYIIERTFHVADHCAGARSGVIAVAAPYERRLVLNW